MFNKRKILKPYAVWDNTSLNLDTVFVPFSSIIYFKTRFSILYFKVVFKEFFPAIAERIYLHKLIGHKNIKRIVFYNGSMYPVHKNYKKIILETGEIFNVEISEWL